MNKENKKPRIQKFLTFFSNALLKTTSKTTNSVEKFSQNLMKSHNSIVKLKRFFYLSFACVGLKTQKKNEGFLKKYSQKMKKCANRVIAVNHITETYRCKKNLLKFFDEVPIKIFQKTKYVLGNFLKKLQIGTKSENIQNKTTKDTESSAQTVENEGTFKVIQPEKSEDQDNQKKQFKDGKTDDNLQQERTLESNNKTQQDSLKNTIIQISQQRQEYYDKQALELQYIAINQQKEQLRFEKQEQFIQIKKSSVRITFKTPQQEKLAEISGNNQALYKAKNLVRKMNQQRKEKEERTRRKYQAMIDDQKQLRIIQEINFNIKQQERKNRIQQRIKQRELIKQQEQKKNGIQKQQKQERLQLQNNNRKLVQKLKNHGPLNGQLSKKFNNNISKIKIASSKENKQNIGYKLPKINIKPINSTFRIQRK